MHCLRGGTAMWKETFSGQVFGDLHGNGQGLTLVHISTQCKHFL